MDAHLFRVFAKNLANLLQGARIEKIQEPAPGIMTITFYGGGKKRQLWIRFSRKDPFCFLTDTRVGAGKEPSAQIMRIRRYFGDRRVASMVCQYYSRKLWLLGAAGTVNENGKAVWLCLDMANGPSLHFLDASDYPQEEKPAWPEPAQLAEAMVHWREWPVLTPVLRKSLALMNEPDQWALIQDLREGNGDIFLYSKMDGEKCESSIERVFAWPLPPQLAAGLREDQRDDILPAFEDAGKSIVLKAIYDRRNEHLLGPIKRRIKNIHKLLAKLEQDEARLIDMRRKEDDARALAANIWKYGREDRAETITAQEEGAEKPRVIKMDKRYTIRQNMEKFFHAARRGKRGLAMLEDRRKELTEELRGLEASPPPVGADFGELETEIKPRKNADADAGSLAKALRKNLPGNVALYVSSDGFIILRGKDARGNHAMRGFASPHDLWAHVETGPGAHVIIRRHNPGEAIPERTLDEAGGLAASKSWLSGAGKASVMYAELRHVKPARNGPAGKMIIDKLLMTRNVPVSEALQKNIVE